MTLEDKLADSLFRAGMSLIRSAVGHAKLPEAAASQAQFFHREMDKECRKLVPRFQGEKIPLQDEAELVV